MTGEVKEVEKDGIRWAALKKTERGALKEMMRTHIF